MPSQPEEINLMPQIYRFEIQWLGDQRVLPPFTTELEHRYDCL